ncbi:MAG: HAMP domain-containing sensor histidine kinase [Micropruina sp.]|uniref:sensor histidine kinase n=1 Tax=Micropruina sp. TaxID=2737536 RepID=UPI0039E3BD38
MRRTIGWSWMAVAGFAVASVGLIAVLYQGVEPFTYYGIRFGSTQFLPNSTAGLALFVAGTALATAACLVDARRTAQHWIHRLDWFFALVGVAAIWALVAGFFESGRDRWVWHLCCLTVLAASGWYLWATMVIRLRAGTLAETIFWPKVFRTLPLNQFAGIFVLAVVAIATFVLVAGAQSAVQAAVRSGPYRDLSLTWWLIGEWGTKVGLAGLTLVAVAVLCHSILSITAAKEAAVEARLREERFRAELITNLTHDLRTPLTSIVSYVDLIAKLDLPEPRLVEYTGVLTRKADRLKGLIGDLLDASRASAGNLPVRLQPIGITEILSQVAGDFDDALTARRLSWVGPPPAADLVLADGGHLCRVLENLVGNAAKYAAPGSCVHADLDRSPRWLRLRIANLTVEPLTLAPGELTAQFVRGDAARTGEGSGLGLFIADRLTQLMGGRLTVTVDQNRFTAAVELPIPQPAASQPVSAADPVRR